jgi:thiol-disulfide isomerase/thioredoxin
MKIKELNISSLKRLIDIGDPFIVKFKSDNCQTCLDIKEDYEWVSERLAPIGFYEVDTDREPELAEVFTSDGVPTLFYIKGEEMTEIYYPEEGYTRKTLFKAIASKTGTKNV